LSNDGSEIFWNGFSEIAEVDFVVFAVFAKNFHVLLGEYGANIAYYKYMA